MEADSCAHQSQMDTLSPGVEEDMPMENFGGVSPVVQKMSYFQTEVTPFSTGDGRLSPGTVRAAQFESVDVQSPQFSTQNGQGDFFSTEVSEARPSVARDDLVSAIPVREAGVQYAAVEHQNSEFGPEGERRTDVSVYDDPPSTLPSTHHGASGSEPGNGGGPGDSDQGSRIQVYDDPGVQDQDECSHISADVASDLRRTESHKKEQFTAQEAFSSSQFPSVDVSDTHLASECEGDSNVLSADEESTHFPKERALDSQRKAENEGAVCPFRNEQDQVSLSHVEMGDGVNPTPDGSRKRKLAVFAAAGAVIAIQTMLVAMPEIWQPLEDDDSAEKGAYQEGLHSWFGALNRAAWLLSTANGAGDGGWWVKPRASVWFNTYLMSSNEDERWLASLRMKRRTFLWICNSLEVHVKKQDTRLRPSIPVMVRVGATIYRLVNGVDYYEVADKFGVGESSVHEIMQDCVPAIVRVFGHHLRWPTGEAMAEVSRAFLDMCGLPNCQGALGSTQVEILNPSGPEAKKYINRTGHFSIVLQAVVDTSLSFLDVFCGHPERTYENKVLRNSSLYGRALQGEILAGPIQSINGGFQLRPYILGGSNYPLLPWLMVPYATSSPLTYSQEQFIQRHEQGKVYTQQAFDILKRVFRVLGVGIRGRLELAPVIVHACCLLYNILIRRKELDVEAELENIGATSHIEDAEEGSAEPGDASSQEIRNQLSEYLVWAS